jgi:hypothetical protein
VAGDKSPSLQFSLSKSIPFRTEGRHLQLRAELFSLFNHPNFDIPSHTLDAPTFGMVLSASAYGSKPPRQVKLNLRYAF